MYITIMTSARLIHEAEKLVLCDRLKGGVGREMGRRFRREGTWVYLWLILVDV